MPKTEDPTKPVSTITFKNPPVSTRYDWRAIAEQLRAQPMEWANIFEHGRTSLVNALRAGKIVALHPDLGFEITTTNNTRDLPRTCDLYMRFNPDKVDPLREEVRHSRGGTR